MHLSNNSRSFLKSKKAVLAGAAVLLSSLLVIQNSANAAPATNGPIVAFGQRLSLVNEDGTSVPSPQALVGPPQYSHDGTKMAWVAQGNNGSSSKIQISNADGTSVKTLLNSSTIQFQKLQFTSTGQILLLKNNSQVLYSIDSTTENQTLSVSNEILTLNVGNINDISVSKNDKLAYINSAACPPPGAGQGVWGVFTRDISGTGAGTLVTGSCEYTVSAKKESRTVVWNAAGTGIFLGFSDMSTSSAIVQSIQLLNPNGGVTPVVTVGTDTSESDMVHQINALAMSPDGTKLALITNKPNSFTFKLWTVKTDGTSLAASTFEPKLNMLSWAQPITLDVVPTTTTVVRTTTTTLATTTTSTTTTLPTSVYASAVPGITVTDPTVYRTAPKEVAGKSAIIVLTPTQNKVMDIVSKTPSVCLPNDDNLVFIDEGKCIAEVVNAKTRNALRTLRTTVVSDDISELQVGNEVAVLAPLYFVAGSFDFKPQSLARLAKLKDRITSAGSVLVAGHSGILLGNTPENIKLSGERAKAAVKELKARGAKGPFSVASVGALDPATTLKTQAAQDKNRRVVIVLIP
jgi:outer membrane protein OmpA-like peptidoglycan-associated protein